MSYYREFDRAGMILAKQQAELFSDASKKELGSYYFLRRYAGSLYCEEIDSLAIINSSYAPKDFWEENEQSISKKGMVLDSYVMHWIGYIYRYWCYIENIRTVKLIQMVPIKFMASIYEAYHSLAPEEVMAYVKETLGLSEEKRRQKVINKFKKLYLSLIQ